MATSKVRLKLLIDTKGQRVLFAEAGKDFVDFLFHLLSLSVGAVVKLFKQNMAGCLGNLYESIENLSDTYIQQNQNKNSLLNPRSSYHVTQIPLLLSEYESNTGMFYSCSNYYSCCTVAEVPHLKCPNCKGNMTRKLTYVSPSASNANENPEGTVAEGGFVKGVVTYMIMDNLEVSPMSSISSITLLNRFKVRDVGGLEEKVVDLGVDEGLKLLKASLECKTVLTSVFLASK